MATLMRQIMPWSGVIGAGAGWYVSQQAAANLVFADCGSGQWWSVTLIGLLGLALVIGGGLLSYRSWRRETQGSDTQCFIGLLGLMVAGVLGFPVLMQTIAGFMVPGCLS
ncbi:hypothetical protein [Sphingobium sp. SCG-1]|uniref:hypothetical protein n=1 Tax=Sphingobium sp. SCG-1 TaxID=2072936 RepID=UPI0016712F6F|nr:hypothetical protein [Sphingobium sp. SCG-1]